MEPTDTAPSTDLSLDDRCLLLGGATAWRTHGFPEAGLPVIKMSDGPNGVRGEAGPEGLVPGVVVPVGIALGATWDPALVERVADLLGKEAVRKGAHVLLGPTVNLARTPIGGRVFEGYSEDPELTARLAVAFVRGVQAHDVGVTVKHFVANDTEVDRLSVDARVAEDVLREYHLRPFEAAVKEADAWGIMSAYNKLNGEHCAENHWLLTEVLREDWGFDGYVVSDWGGVHDTVGAARAGLTLAMPGPETVFGPALAAAVRRGDVDEEQVDGRVAELRLLAERTRAAERSADKAQETVEDPAERALCREAAVAGLVLARNEEAALPLAPEARVVVIGPNAVHTRALGGGSSTLRSLDQPTIAEALTDRLGDRLLGVHQGTTIDRHLPVVDRDRARTPDGRPGFLVEFRNGTDPDAPVVATQVTERSAVTNFGSAPDGVGDGQYRITIVGEVVPEHDGPHRFGATITGKGRVTVGDTVVLDDPDRTLPRGEWLYGFGCEEQTEVVECRAGVPVPVHISTTGVRRFAAVSFGMAPVIPPPRIEQAEAAAAEADVAVVVVGTSDEWETEGADRTTIALPGDQDELVRRVAAAAPHTVVVVNAGGPVALPWLDEVDAVLLASFGGQETGPAVADVLVGAADPGGRLPVTYPVRLEDAPAWPHYAPVDGVQTYGEGRLFGYRGHDASGVAPTLPFGHGLSYGPSTWGEARLSAGSTGPSGSAGSVAADEGVTVAVDVTATGDRPATEVVQVYVTHPHPDQPPKALAAFAKAVVAPGDTVTVEVAVPAAAWRRWDLGTGGWVVDPGPRQVLVAASAADVRSTLTVDVA